MLALLEEEERERRTGRFCEDAVEGLRSWVGEGARLRERDWRVEVRVAAGLEAIVFLFLCWLWGGEGRGKGGGRWSVSGF